MRRSQQLVATQHTLNLHPRLTRYYRGLARRPSFAKVIADARPYRELFPLPWPADFDRYH